ncbi:MAG: DUF523 domain-containing protein [Desulfobacteraceae bacterium]|nr:DUF523 domain-containing protein [Desulfobacteraceae bacterium]
MEKILISACLLGKKVRYNGNPLSINENIIDKWNYEKRIISVCPEVNAGMSIPRLPAEILKGDGNDVLSGNAFVYNKSGQDVTEYFINGANLALSLCKQHDIKIALLKESSPSCGSTSIYDGSFKGNLIKGVGVTTALLKKNGIQVFSEFSISEANAHIK